MTTFDATIPNNPIRDKPRPLSVWQQLIAPVKLAFANGSEATYLRECIEFTRDLAKQKADKRELYKQLQAEARAYAALISQAYAQHGEFYAYTRVHAQGTIPGGGRRRNTRYVQFDKFYVTPEQIFMRIKTRKKTFWGTTTALPHRVQVAELVCDEMLFELGHTIYRKVEAIYDNPLFGAWIVINRLKGVGGLPRYVTFEQMLPHYPEDVSNGPIVLGVAAHREVQIANLEDRPHVLIAGTTGGGKSNMVNNIICGLMRYTEPNDVKFLLIDLKRMEFVFYKDAPHLLQPPIVTAKGAIKALRYMMREVIRRAKMFSGKVKNLSDWNKRYEKLPRLVCIIDEFAELMLASGKDVRERTTTLVTRINNLGRAVGVHLIVCTQRPAVTVLPNSIKINMPLIISGRTQNRDQSKVILGSGEAAMLEHIPGRMIYTSDEKIEIQTPFISDQAVRQTVRLARARAMGLTKLRGLDTVINPPGLAAYIVDHLGGSLAKSQVIPRVLRMGVNRSEIEAWLERTVQLGGLRFDDAAYAVVKRGAWWFLERKEKEKPRPILQGLPAFVPYGLLPPPADYVPVVEKPKTGDPVKDFIEEHCEFDVTFAERSLTLYEAFLQVHHGRKITQQRFGMKLTELGFAKERRGSKGQFWRIGLKLKNEQSQPSEQNNSHAKSEIIVQELPEVIELPPVIQLAQNLEV